MVKLKDIPGLMIEKKVHARYNDEYLDGIEDGHNNLIDDLGSVDIGLNRERLAAFLYNRKIKNYRVPTDEDILEVTAESYREADAIISAEATLLEKIN